MQYKNSVRKFIAEEYVNTKIEYKLWIFAGKCKFIKIEIMNEFGFVKKSDNPTLYRFICKCRKRSTTRERVTTEEI